MQNIFETAEIFGANEIMLGWNGKEDCPDIVEEKKHAFMFRNAGVELGIPIVEQLVFSKNEYYAMSENGVSSGSVLAYTG